MNFENHCGFVDCPNDPNIITRDCSICGNISHHMCSNMYLMESLDSEEKEAELFERFCSKGCVEIYYRNIESRQHHDNNTVQDDFKTMLKN